MRIKTNKMADHDEIRNRELEETKVESKPTELSAYQKRKLKLQSNSNSIKLQEVNK